MSLSQSAEIMCKEFFVPLVSCESTPAEDNCSLMFISWMFPLSIFSKPANLFKEVLALWSWSNAQSSFFMPMPGFETPSNIWSTESLPLSTTWKVEFPLSVLNAKTSLLRSCRCTLLECTATSFLDMPSTLQSRDEAGLLTRKHKMQEKCEVWDWS